MAKWWSPCVRGCPDAGWPGPGRSEGLHRASPTTSVPWGSRTPITRARAGPRGPTVARGGSAPALLLAHRSSLGPPFSNSPPHEDRDNSCHLVEGGRRRRKDATRRKPGLPASLIGGEVRMTGQQRVSRPIIRPRAKSGEKDALPRWANDRVGCQGREISCTYLDM